MESMAAGVPWALPEPDDHELQLIDAALEMVASGDASRVVLAGFQHATSFLPFVQDRAEGVGLRARALWRDEGCDIAIERNG